MSRPPEAGTPQASGTLWLHCVSFFLVKWLNTLCGWSFSFKNKINPNSHHVLSIRPSVICPCQNVMEKKYFPACSVLHTELRKRFWHKYALYWTLRNGCLAVFPRLVILFFIIHGWLQIKFRIRDKIALTLFWKKLQQSSRFSAKWWNWVGLKWNELDQCTFMSIWMWIHCDSLAIEWELLYTLPILSLLHYTALFVKMLNIFDG